MKLFLVPTPIGNLDDITLRSIKTLQKVDVIFAEDTRNSGVLLKHLGISKPLFSHHAHNEHHGVAGVIKLIKEGKQVALISDAGTPAISDPGFLLVRACLLENIEIECLPGATAFVPALVNSGLPADRFTFEGFLPQKKGRQTALKNLQDEERTMIFYESPHRLIKTLTQFAEYYGTERKISVARELSKMYEENIRGTVAEVLQHYTNNPNSVKGEIVIVLAGKE
ncbi:MAG: 16S rRNA (cytidine(1402)-2'-O)-methyltransferase [Pseudarcicella sp.]|nr:16S rRNA (cytidine(1402)-2'-O)-methyltransferase [Pseudarcicella sp.]MBP6411467.1 16S rRNA (cytidine(1402)-2'-O)-methyltransferase [Pseudarcicella sp.]